uniref:Uncharacterized protein n=1 Tax=Schistocephalus solidus TaxID=70667 RepID=A0A0X3PBW9_SCHSO
MTTPNPVSVSNTHVTIAENFPYRESTILVNIKIDDEIASLICKAGHDLGRLNHFTLNRHGILFNIKLRAQSAAVLATLFYGTAKWTKQEDPTICNSEGEVAREEH